MTRIYLLFALSMMLVFAQAPAGVPAQMVVTVVGNAGQPLPDVSRDRISIFEGDYRLPITDWTALRGQRAGVDLFILIDEACSGPRGRQLTDLRAFVRSLPSTTSIGVSYARNGIAEIAQELTKDHDRAAQALRPPQGNCATALSPYLSLNDLLTKLPESNAAHEVLLFSSGAEPLNSFGALNPFLEAAIEHAQLGGVNVHALYSVQAQHIGASFLKANIGQNYLARLAQETGGQSYLLDLSNGTALGEYLTKFSDALNHQYLVSFLARPCGAPTLASVRFESDLSNVVIFAARKVLVWPSFASGVGF